MIDLRARILIVIPRSKARSETGTLAMEVDDRPPSDGGREWKQNTSKNGEGILVRTAHWCVLYWKIF